MQLQFSSVLCYVDMLQIWQCLCCAYRYMYINAFDRCNISRGQSGNTTSSIMDQPVRCPDLEGEHSHACIAIASVTEALVLATGCITLLFTLLLKLTSAL